jgi:acetone carboxylase gamma subunit
MAEKIECECGYTFGRKFNNTKNHVNMRTTWSGQTQVEFSQQSMQESVEGMGGEW